jgi:hypothetical protein
MTKACVPPIYTEKFLEDLNRFIRNDQKYEDSESLTCDKIFENPDNYSKEKIYLQEIYSGNFNTTKDRGDALEKLIRELFNRIDLLSGINHPVKQTIVGQLDIQYSTRKDFIYDVWDFKLDDMPDSGHIIRECKNYADPVGREEIERICWRAIKSACLTFFIATEYTQPAIDEIAYFNKHKKDFLIRHKGVYIILLSLPMIKVVVENDINFCRFIKWAIFHSKNINSITNYLKL